MNVRYCFYCGKQVDDDAEECPHCFENISDSEENNKYNAFVECIKCKSMDVEYSIVRKNKKGIVYEEQVYTCKNCGKKFKDKNRLGHSFSNKFQLILSDKQKQIFKWLLIIFIIGFFVIQNEIKINNEQNSWTRIDYSGLPSVTFKEIKEEAHTNLDKTRKKYVNNTYIFNTTVREINGRKISTQIEDGAYSGAYIYVNNEDIEKLKSYKEGDSITIAGTVYKISGTYHTIYIQNATVIE